MPEHQTHENLTYTEPVMNRFREVNELYDSTLNKINRFMYSINITTNECFTFRNAMKQEDKMSMVEATRKKITNHEAGIHWSVFHCDNLLNKARPIKSIWSFKRKKKPDGNLLKNKACLCAHDGMKKWGDSYWETYCPVVNMLSVPLILAIKKIHKMESKAIDFVLAFPQADLKEEIWMNLPIRFQVDSQTESNSDRH